MGYTKQTVDNSGLTKIRGVLDFLDQDYHVEELCAIRDRSRSMMEPEEGIKKVRLKALTFPDKDGAFYQTLKRRPGPDQNDFIILRKTKLKNKDDFTVLIKEGFKPIDDRKEYNLEEVKNGKHETTVVPSN